MKRSLIFFATVALCVASCGTAGEFSASDRFQDGIYYKPDPRVSARMPLSEQDFRYLAQMDNFSSQLDTAVIPDQVGDDSVSDSDRDYSWYYGWYPYSHWRYYNWGYYPHWGYYSYWGSPYYYYGYDPFWWDYGWYGSPYYHGYYGWGYPYHHYYGHYYGGWSRPGNHTRRYGSATSGRYSHPGSYRGTPPSRTASSMAQRDIDRLKASRTTLKTSAMNRETGYSETSKYRSGSATRANSSASYNSNRDQRSSTRYDSSSSSRSSSTRSSGGYSGGGSSSGGHSSHSSGGGGYHGGGHGGHR